MQVKITAICLLLSIWYSHREKPAFLLPFLVPGSVKEEGSCLTWYGLPYTRGLEKQSPGKKSSYACRKCQDSKRGDAVLVMPLMGSFSWTDKNHWARAMKTLGTGGDGETHR